MSLELSDYVPMSDGRRLGEASTRRSFVRSRRRPNRSCPWDPVAKCDSRGFPSPPAGDVFLVRVFVDVAVGSETAVTVYRTSKIAKYWRST